MVGNCDQAGDTEHDELRAASENEATRRTLVGLVAKLSIPAVATHVKLAEADSRAADSPSVASRARWPKRHSRTGTRTDSKVINRGCAPHGSREDLRAGLHGRSCACQVGGLRQGQTKSRHGEHGGYSRRRRSSRWSTQRRWTPCPRGLRHWRRKNRPDKRHGARYGRRSNPVETRRQSRERRYPGWTGWTRAGASAPRPWSRARTRRVLTTERQRSVASVSSSTNPSRIGRSYVDLSVPRRERPRPPFWRRSLSLFRGTQRQTVDRPPAARHLIPDPSTNVIPRAAAVVLRVPTAGRRRAGPGRIVLVSVSTRNPPWRAEHPGDPGRPTRRFVVTD